MNFWEEYKIDRFDLNLTNCGDLIYHEGPFVSHFLSDTGEHYFYDWFDCDNNHNYWLVYKITDSDLKLFLNKKLPFNDLVKNNDYVYILAIDSDIEITNVYYFPSKIIPSEYLRKDNIYFDTAIHEPYCLTLLESLK